MVTYQETLMYRDKYQKQDKTKKESTITYSKKQMFPDFEY